MKSFGQVSYDACPWETERWKVKILFSWLPLKKSKKRILISLRSLSRKPRRNGLCQYRKIYRRALNLRWSWQQCRNRTGCLVCCQSGRTNRYFSCGPPPLPCSYLCRIHRFRHFQAHTGMRIAGSWRCQLLIRFRLEAAVAYSRQAPGQKPIGQPRILFS
jgi:hypothetical protein